MPGLLVAWIGLTRSAAMSLLHFASGHLRSFELSVFTEAIGQHSVLAELSSTHHLSSHDHQMFSLGCRVFSGGVVCVFGEYATIVFNVVWEWMYGSGRG